MTAVLCCVVLCYQKREKWSMSCRVKAVVWCGVLPDDEELRIALHTLIARELTGTGNTTRQNKRREEKKDKRVKDMKRKEETDKCDL